MIWSSLKSENLKIFAWICTANGYSSLAPIHLTAYSASVVISQNHLIFSIFITRLLISLLSSSCLKFDPLLGVLISGMLLPQDCHTIILMKQALWHLSSWRSDPSPNSQVHPLFLESPHSPSFHGLLSNSSYYHLLQNNLATGWRASAYLFLSFNTFSALQPKRFM